MYTLIQHTYITGNLNKIETNKYKMCINKCINVYINVYIKLKEVDAFCR